LDERCAESARVVAVLEAIGARDDEGCVEGRLRDRPGLGVAATLARGESGGSEGAPMPRVASRFVRIPPTPCGTAGGRGGVPTVVKEVTEKRHPCLHPPWSRAPPLLGRARNTRRNPPWRAPPSSRAGCRSARTGGVGRVVAWALRRRDRKRVCGEERPSAGACLPEPGVVTHHSAPSSVAPSSPGASERPPGPHPSSRPVARRLFATRCAGAPTVRSSAEQRPPSRVAGAARPRKTPGPRDGAPGVVSSRPEGASTQFVTHCGSHAKRAQARGPALHAIGE
jgi:hypothetical protein